MARHLAVILLATLVILGVGLRSEDVRTIANKAQQVVEVLRSDGQDAVGLRPTATPTPDDS